MKDLIDRQAAIDAIEEYADRLQMMDWKENPGVPYKAYALNWCINTIRDLPSAQPESCEYWDAESNYCALNRPSAQPERKKAQWKEDPSGYGFWICSNCGFVSEASGANILYSFCPHCGVEMKGEDDETD